VCVAGQPCARVSACGNGRIEAGEDCDDGNQEDGDGCSRLCRLEAGYTCATPGIPCKPAPRCGDGVVESSVGEVCDDGNQKDGDGCSADCKNKGAAAPAPLASCACVPSPSVATARSKAAKVATTATPCPATAVRERAPSSRDTAAPSQTPRACPTVATASCLLPWNNAIRGHRHQHGPGMLQHLQGQRRLVCTGNPPSCHQTVCG